RQVWERIAIDAEEARLSVLMSKFAVDVWARPLDAALLLDRLVRHRRVVAQAVLRYTPPLLECLARAPPTPEPTFTAAQTPGERQEDIEVTARFSRRRDRAVHLARAPFRVGIGPLLLSPDRCWQYQVGMLAGWCRMEAVLDDEKLHLAQSLLHQRHVRERN